MKTRMLLMFVLSALTFSAMAQQTPVVNARQASQRARIRGGVASGELTRPEAAGLRGQQRHIRRTERRAKADGVVTPKEQKRLAREQRRANRAIRRQKHDGQTRPQ